MAVARQFSGVLAFAVAIGAQVFAQADSQSEDASSRAVDSRPAHVSKSIQQLLDAAADGSGQAMLNLGMRFAKGQGVPQDYAESARWNRMAADLGHTEAMFNLGVSFAKGEGVPKDAVAKHSWLSVAGALGQRGATKARASVEATMTGEQIAEAQKRRNESRRS